MKWLYARERIPLSWIVDHRERVIHVVRTGAVPEPVTETLRWHPDAAAEPFVLDVAAFFATVIGPPAP